MATRCGAGKDAGTPQGWRLEPHARKDQAGYGEEWPGPGARR